MIEGFGIEWAIKEIQKVRAGPTDQHYMIDDLLQYIKAIHYRILKDEVCLVLEYQHSTNHKSIKRLITKYRLELADTEKRLLKAINRTKGRS